MSLLAEHTGLEGRAALRALVRADRLVAFLDGVAESGLHRLRLHPLETVFDQNPLLKPLEPEDLLIDPEDSVLDEGTLWTPLRQDRGCWPHGFRSSPGGSSASPS